MKKTKETNYINHALAPLQILDNLKLGAMAMGGKNRNIVIKKLNKMLDDYPESVIENAIDGEDVIDSYGGDGKNSFWTSRALEILGPDMLAKGALKGTPKIAKLVASEKVGNKILKLGKPITKITEAVDKSTNVEDIIKGAGKGIKKVSEMAGGSKPLETVSEKLKQVKSLFPSGLDEKIRRESFRPLAKSVIKKSGGSTNSQINETNKLIKKISELRSNGEKIRASEFKKLADSATEAKIGKYGASDKAIEPILQAQLSQGKKANISAKELVDRASEIATPSSRSEYASKSGLLYFDGLYVPGSAQFIKLLASVSQEKKSNNSAFAK